MPENPWASADNGETRRWVPVTPPGGTGPTGSVGSLRPAGPWRSGGGNGGLIVVVVVATLVGALLASALIWIVARGGDDDGGSTSFSSVPEFSGVPTVTASVTAAPAPEPEPTVATSTGGDAESGSSSGVSGGSLPSGLSSRGWSGYSNATCNGSDTWVYAGGSDSTKVVVCRATARDGSSLGLYYRGHAGGQGLERDVDMSSADIDEGYFEIPANPATIVIDGDRMTVRKNGSVEKSYDFDVALTR